MASNEQHHGGSATSRACRASVVKACVKFKCLHRSFLYIFRFLSSSFFVREHILIALLPPAPHFGSAFTNGAAGTEHKQSVRCPLDIQSDGAFPFRKLVCKPQKEPFHLCVPTGARLTVAGAPCPLSRGSLASLQLPRMS